MTQPVLPLGHTVDGNKLVTLDGISFVQHKHIIGISGSGKSSFIASIVVFLLRQGISFCLIDPHGDLAKLIISLLASSNFYNNPRAYDRLWYVDFNRQDASIAWNVLKQEHITNY
jgi:DNA helicase HerA-like ATPase